jgi:hypothetical protein
MTRLERSTVIELPVGEVFAFVAHVENNLRWQPSLLEVEVVTDGPVGVGSWFWERRRVLGITVVSEYVIEEFEPPRRCSVRSVAGPLSFRIAYDLRPTVGGTLMNVVGEVTQQAIFGLAARAATGSADRELAANLRTLKRVLEEVEPPIEGAVA